MLFWWVTSLVACAATGLAGYMVGHHTCGKQMADLMYRDREIGTQVLEKLAERWGARLELVQSPESPR